MSAAKRSAAEAAADLVEDGMLVGLGTGSTVAFLLPALVGKAVRCVATSIATETAARDLGLQVEPFDALDALDIAIDGADEVTPEGWLVKGGGGAHVREKVVAAAAARFVVVADASKAVDRLTWPVPLELLAFGLPATLRALGVARVREGAPPSPDGGVIADWHGDVSDPAAAAALLGAVPGVVDHGLFPPALVHDVVLADDEGRVEHRVLQRRRARRP